LTEKTTALAAKIIRKAHVQMKIHEYQVKELSIHYWIPIPDDQPCRTTQETVRAADEVSFPAVARIVTEIVN